MCTVVFIPKGNKYFFASLRDESPLRPVALAPCIKKGDTNVLSPVDAKGGGTWLGVTAAGTVIILLNGGFEKHTCTKNYRKSRGLIVTELLRSNSPVESWNSMDMNGIEPYTLVVMNEGTLFQLVWDGNNKHGVRLRSNEPHIWSSATLYDQQASQYRSQLFHQWMGMNIPVSSHSLLDFFKSFTDSENGFLMNRADRIKTLSYSFIEFHAGATAILNYHDFATDTTTSKQIMIAAPSANSSKLARSENHFLTSK